MKKLVISGGRQTGKTTILADIARTNASTRPGIRILVIAPTRSMLDLLIEKISVDENIARIIQSPTFIEYKNGSTIAFRTATSKDTEYAFMGRGGFRPDILLIDGVEYINTEFYEEIMRSVNAEMVVETRLEYEDGRVLE